jgi:hypothetical protein
MPSQNHRVHGGKFLTRITSENVVILDRKGKDLCTEGEHCFTKVTPWTKLAEDLKKR